MQFVLMNLPHFGLPVGSMGFVEGGFGGFAGRPVRALGGEDFAARGAALAGAAALAVGSGTIELAAFATFVVSGAAASKGALSSAACCADKRSEREKAGLIRSEAPSGEDASIPKTKTGAASATSETPTVA